MPLAPGSRLGPYEVLAPLGAGGMGEVYRARDPRLGREVALKLLPGAFAGDADRVARLEREARVVAGLNHPNIVTLYSVEEADGARFLTMELVDGQSLAELVAPGGLPVTHVLALALPLADALVAAHAKGVVHRDLKPANVMVTAEGRVKVLDFGLARAAAEPAIAGAPTPLSITGAVLGTGPYMAPEQIRGEAVDARTDLFAFGVLVHELLAGRRPFEGATLADMFSSILRDAPPPLASAPPALAGIVTRCLAKAAADRFASARELHDALRAVELAPERVALSPPAKPAPSIAVLPFSNLSADPENEYFSDGLAEELLNALAKVPELKVTGRTSSFAFKGRSEDLRAIGHKLGVATLLEGSVRKAGNRVRITAQLIKADDGFHLWSETYDRVLDDVFAVQDEITGSVMSALHVTLLGRSASAPTIAPAPDHADHALLLQANQLSLLITGPSVERAVTLYQEILARSPGNASAWAGLARARGFQSYYGLGEAAECFRLSWEATEKAIALDARLARAYEIRAQLLGIESRWVEAAADVRRARELAPGDTAIMRTAAMLAAYFERYDEALPLVRRAQELDPLNPDIHMGVGRIESWAGHDAAAAEAYQRALELSPETVALHAHLGMVFLRLGQPDRALEEIARERQPGYREWAFAIAYHELGRTAEADAAAGRMLALGDDWAFQIAGVYAIRGDSDRAFHWLERAHALHDSGVGLTRVSPLLRPLRGDPRWAPYVAKVGLAG